jgi:hypothetical protein
MPFFYLKNERDLPPECRFYTQDTVDQSSLSIPIIVTLYNVPVFLEYTGDYIDEHSWTNLLSGECFFKHPLELTICDRTFLDGFYEIMKFGVMEFDEGDVWNPKTCQKEHVSKPGRDYVWNSICQCYEQQCNECYSGRIKYDFVNHKIDSYFISKEMHLFFEVYCKCCVCEHCNEIHTFSCRKGCRI